MWRTYDVFRSIEFCALIVCMTLLCWDMQNALGIMGIRHNSAAMVAAERFMLIVFRISPHAAIFMAVVLHQAAFASRASHGLAVAGLLYVNAINAVKACRTFGTTNILHPRGAELQKGK